MAVAGFEAFKAVNNRVKEVGGLDADGYDLMSRAFGGERDSAAQGLCQWHTDKTTCSSRDDGARRHEGKRNQERDAPLQG